MTAPGEDNFLSPKLDPEINNGFPKLPLTWCPRGKHVRCLVPLSRILRVQWKWLEKRYPAFEALIHSDSMFNQSLKSGLVSFCMGEVKGKHITHLLTMNYASNHWENKYTIILWIKVAFNLNDTMTWRKVRWKKYSIITFYHITWISQEKNLVSQRS